MGLPKLKSKISVEEYLKTEMLSSVKREFVEGEVYAMAGASDNHNLIAGEMYVALVNQIKDPKCKPFFGDMKVRVTRKVYYYPDVVVSCEEDPENPYFRNQPILIIEVTSPSTERVDKSEKLLYYLQMPSLWEYVVIDQHEMKVEVHRRQTSGAWITYCHDETSDIVELESVDLSIPLPDLYRRVQFKTDASREN